MKRKPRYKLITKLVEIPITEIDRWNGISRYYKIISQKQFI
jgi:hypothetical protein